MFIEQPERRIDVYTELSFEENVMKNRVLYRGRVRELTEFFTQLGGGRFWGGRTKRKIHSGIISAVIDRYTDIVTADYNGISTDSPYGKEIDSIICELLPTAIKQTLITGDGAFKISIDPDVSQMPIVEFVSAQNTEYSYNRGRLTEVCFKSVKREKGKQTVLKERYTTGSVREEISDIYGNVTEYGKNTPLPVPVIAAVPFKIFHSEVYKNRGKALFDSKSEISDALDEVISLWAQAVRSGKVRKYIPLNLIPRDENTGALKTAGLDLQEDFVHIRGSFTEGEDSITVIQPKIDYLAYKESYSAYLDLLLTGIMSPATLGIDLKLTDSAVSRREKEKITIYVRQRITNALVSAIKELTNVYSAIASGKNKKYETSVHFGEYAGAGFEETVETVAKAKQAGIMSTQKAVEELYGDELTAEEKRRETERINEANTDK